MEKMKTLKTVSDSLQGPCKKAGEFLTDAYKNYVPNLAVLPLFLVSCYTTFSGLNWLMGSVETMSHLAGIFISAAITMGIQLMLLYSISSLTKSLKRRKKALFLTIYLVTVFFSVGLGYACYFKHLRSTNFGFEVLGREARRLEMSAQNYLAQLEILSQNLATLAEHSKKQSEIEDTRGGTCGDNSPVGNGPRAKGRRADGEIFSTYNERFGELVGEQQEDLDSLRTELSVKDPAQLENNQKALEGFYVDMSGRSSEAVALWNELNGYIDTRFPGGRYSIGEFRCVDEMMEHMAVSLQGLIFPDLPEEPEKFEADDPKVVVTFALKRMSGMVTGSFRWVYGIVHPASVSVLERNRRQQVAGIGTAEDNDLKDTLPLFLGLLVDSLIFLAAFSTTKRDPEGTVSDPEGSDPDDWPANPFAKPLILLREENPNFDQDLRKNLAEVLACNPQQVAYTIEQLLRRFHKRSFLWMGLFVQEHIMVPFTGNGVKDRKEVKKLHLVIGMLESLGLTKGVPVEVKWRNLPDPLPHGMGELKDEFGDDLEDEFVLIYKVKKGLLQGLVREYLKNDRLPLAA